MGSEVRSITRPFIFIAILLCFAAPLRARAVSLDEMILNDAALTQLALRRAGA
jgi:hypothetical protein